MFFQSFNPSVECLKIIYNLLQDMMEYENESK